MLTLTGLGASIMPLYINIMRLLSKLIVCRRCYTGK